MEREIKRKIVHIIVGISFVLLVYFELFEAIHFVLLFFIGLTSSLICRRARFPVLSWFLDRLERPEEIKRFPGKGVITFVAGAGIAVLLFSKIAALTAIIVLAFADAASLIIGRYFGKYVHPFNSNKHLEGLIAAFIFGIPAALVFLPTFLAFIVSAFAAVIETTNIRFGRWQVDDNLSVPIATGLITTLLLLIH
jgi:dolichol kinase